MSKAGWVNRYKVASTHGKFGFSVTEPSNGEWELAVFITGRQDDQTSYGVILTQCDDLVRVRTGLVPTDRVTGCVLGEIGSLIHEARWHDVADIIDTVKDYMKKFWDV